MEDVDQPRAIATVVVAAIVVAFMAACTGASPTRPVPSDVTAPVRTSSSGADSSSSPTIEPTSMPGAVVATSPSAEPLIATLETQSGSTSLGPFPRTSDRVAIYFTCVGSGVATISIPGVAEFPNDCAPDVLGMGTRNAVDVRYVEEISVSVEAPTDATWAISLTEIGEETEGQ